MTDPKLHALLIAADRYDHRPRLRGAVKGAERFEQVLLDRCGVPESQLIVLPNKLATVTRIEQALRAYTSEGDAPLGPQDRLIVYFAGHGVYDPVTESGYLVPIEAARGGVSGCLSYDLLARFCRSIAARHILMIVDACFSGAALRGDQMAEAPSAPVLRRLNQLPGRHLLTSGGFEPVDDHGFAGMSPFTWALTSVLASTDQAVLTSEQVYARIRNIVVDNAAQTPAFGQMPGAGHQGGQFLWFLDPKERLALEGMPVASTPAPSTNVPLPDASYVPDGDLLAQLITALEEVDPRRILVTGMGGVGKTELILQALSRTRLDGWSRVHFVDLGLSPDDSTSVSPTQLLSGLVSQVSSGGFEAATDQLELRQQWQALTDDQDLLLVIDNVPHPEIWSIIQPANACKIVVGSRLRLAGFATVIAVMPVEPRTGARLALTIANNSDPNRLEEINAEALHGACDGLPLAIRVAAAAIEQNPWLDVSSFIDSLKAVGADAPKADDWDRRVLARLRLSLQHLPDQMRERWTALSLFRGSFQTSATAALWEVENASGPLHDLTIRHLIMVQNLVLPSGAIQTRYRLHDLMRALAQDNVPEPGLTGWRRLLAYYARIVTRLDQLGRGAVAIDLRDQNFLISQDIDAIRDGIDFAKADHEWESAEHLVTFALSEAISRRLAVPEQLDLVERALATIARWRNREPEACDRFQQQLLLEKAQALRGLSRPEEALQALGEGLKIAEQVDSRPNQAAFWGAMGSLLLTQSERTEQALKAFRLALKFLDKDSSKTERSALLNNCGNAFLRLGNLKAAKDAYWISQSLDEEIGDQAGVATAQGNLANIAIFEGDYADGSHMAEHAAAIEAELGLDQARAQSLQIAGKARFLNGDMAAAKGHFSDALAVHEALGHLISATKARANLAAVAFQAGDLENAYQIARGAAKTAHANDHLAEAAGAIRTISAVLMEQNRLSRSFKTIKCALALHTQTHSRAEMIEDVLALVLLYLKDQQPEVAERYLTQAKEWADDHGQPHHHAKCRALRETLDSAHNNWQK